MKSAVVLLVVLMLHFAIGGEPDQSDAAGLAIRDRLRASFIGMEQLAATGHVKIEIEQNLVLPDLVQRGQVITFLDTRQARFVMVSGKTRGGFDGHQNWPVMALPDGDKRLSGGLARWYQYFPVLLTHHELIFMAQGKDEHGGRPCQVVRVSHPGIKKPICDIWVDMETGLPLRTGELGVEGGAFYSDYQLFGGVLYPQHIRLQGIGVVFEQTITHIGPNPDATEATYKEVK